MQQLRTAYPDLPHDSRQWKSAAKARQCISSVKELFSGRTGTEMYAIRIQLRENRTVEYRFDHDALVLAFRPVVQGVLRQIHARITAPVNARITKVILAGGWASRHTYAVRSNRILHALTRMPDPSCWGNCNTGKLSSLATSSNQ